MDSQRALGQLGSHDDVIRAAAARGTLAVSCQQRGSGGSRVWNLETMQCTAMLPKGPEGIETTTACCTEGKVFLGQINGIVKLWDVAASAPVALADLEGHTSDVNSIKASAAGSMALSGSGDRTVRLWDLRTNRCVRTMEGHSAIHREYGQWIWTGTTAQLAAAQRTRPSSCGTWAVGDAWRRTRGTQEQYGMW